MQASSAHDMQRRVTARHVGMPSRRPPQRAKSASQGEVPQRLRRWLRWLLEDLELQGRNQTDAAEALGVSPATITNKKKDREGVGIEFAIALARALDKSVEYLAINEPPLTHAITTKVGRARNQA
jgi:DNA-binding XRE family transcriptional regulator